MIIPRRANLQVLHTETAFQMQDQAKKRKLKLFHYGYGILHIPVFRWNRQISPDILNSCTFLAMRLLAALKSDAGFWTFMKRKLKNVMHTVFYSFQLCFQKSKKRPRCASKYISNVIKVVTSRISFTKIHGGKTTTLSIHFSRVRAVPKLN